MAPPKSKRATTVKMAVKILNIVVRALVFTASVERVSEPEDRVLEVNAHATLAAPNANISWFVSNLSARCDAKLLPMENASITASRVMANASDADSFKPIMSKFGMEISHLEALTAFSLSTSNPKKVHAT